MEGINIRCPGCMPSTSISLYAAVTLGLISGYGDYVSKESYILSYILSFRDFAVPRNVAIKLHFKRPSAVVRENFLGQISIKCSE